MVWSSSVDPQCIGLGICALDYIIVVANYPNLDEKVESLEFCLQGGGPVPNALCTLSRFGVRTTYIGKCGNDRDGDMIVQELALFGVGTKYLIRDPESRTARAFILVETKSGKRTVILDKSQIGNLSPNEIPRDIFKNVKFLLLDGRDQDAARLAAMAARNSGAQVILDAGSARPGLEELFFCIDHLVCSEKFAFKFTQTDNCDKAILELHGFGFKSAVITCGAEGSIGIAQNGKLVRQKAFDVDVVDTTGAGDTYHGAFIYGLIQGWNLDRIMLFSSAAAALNCTKIGGRHGIPELTDVYKLLKWKA